MFYKLWACVSLTILNCAVHAFDGCNTAFLTVEAKRDSEMLLLLMDQKTIHLPQPAAIHMQNLPLVNQRKWFRLESVDSYQNKLQLLVQ
jgi:hypothetical protein